MLHILRYPMLLLRAVGLAGALASSDLLLFSKVTHRLVHLVFIAFGGADLLDEV